LAIEKSAPSFCQGGAQRALFITFVLVVSAFRWQWYFKINFTNFSRARGAALSEP